MHGKKSAIFKAEGGGKKIHKAAGVAERRDQFNSPNPKKQVS